MIKRELPRVVIAGTHSGCGKTTLVCGILQALLARGLDVVSFKCGPDYIDPMFHSEVIGAKSRNLDTFFYSHDILRHMICRNTAANQLAVIEGVMGYYDGVGEDGMTHSTYEIAAATGAPVVLVADGRGASTSILAMIKGFVELLPQSGIKAVILNRVSEGVYEKVKEQLEKLLPQVKMLGYLPVLPPELVLESRHLGLVTPAELENLRELLKRLADILLKTVNIEQFIQFVNSALPLEYEKTVQIKPESKVKVRIAVARDKAFCFYYEDNLDLLRELGAEIIETSPLNDRCLPENTHGIIFGGGYPELYLDELSGNESYCESVRAALGLGVPCIAECGGFMYLTESIENREMVGFLRGKCSKMQRLRRFGYVELFAKNDSMLLKPGEKLRGHEYHYYDCTENGGDFTAIRPNGEQWPCVNAGKNLYAGFPHIHFQSNLLAAQRFVARCRELLKQGECAL